MKTTKPAFILLALVLLTTALPVEAMVKPEISNTRTASCLVKITTDEAVLPLNEFVVEDLLRSSGIAGKAAREVLGISPDIAPDLFEIEEIFGVDSALGGMGIGVDGMDLPAGAMPGASTLGAATATRSTRLTTPTPTRIPTRAPTARTSRPVTSTTIPTRPKLYPTPTLPEAPSYTTEQTILFHLHVDFSQGSNEEPIKPAAEEFMLVLIDNLRSTLKVAFEQYNAKLDKQLKLSFEETARAEKELIQMHAQLRDISGSRDLSREAILGDISVLRQQIQSTRMKMASDETLYEATAKRVAEEQARREKLVQDDPITSEFKSMLDVHKKRLVETQKLYESGSASAADLDDVKEKIIRARIELAKRQDEVSNPPGGIVLSSFNNELANLSTQIALAQQEIRSFEEQLTEPEVLLERADDYDLLSLKADIARQNLEETLLSHARLSRNIRSIQPPDVTVIGAE
jgi:hypothetical protein